MANKTVFKVGDRVQRKKVRGLIGTVIEVENRPRLVWVRREDGSWDTAVDETKPIRHFVRALYPTNNIGTGGPRRCWADGKYLELVQEGE